MQSKEPKSSGSERDTTKCSSDKLPLNVTGDALKKKLCWVLRESLQPQGAPGLSLHELTNFRTGVRRIVGVVLRSCRKDDGLLLNHCPFCGTSLEGWSERGQNAAPHKTETEAL